MARPPRAREKALDAYQALLIEEGDRGATIAAVAERSGASKGGVLYHFPSKESLVDALCERSLLLAEDDIREMHAADENYVARFLRTSLAAGTPLDETLTALSRLAQNADEAAARTLERIRGMWADSLRPYCRDSASLDLVLLVSDGLWYNNVQGDHSANPQGPDFERLIQRVVAIATGA